jgi:superfamily II DNA or RNA helicase
LTELKSIPAQFPANLWPHQKTALQICIDHFNSENPRGLVQMPTGTGKSRVIRLLTYYALSQRVPVVIAAPTEEILGQFADDLRRETRTPFYLDKAELRRPASCLITLASQATLWRRLDSYPQGSLLLFDECHHVNQPASCNRKSLSRFRLALGFSASPWSPECVELFGSTLFTYPLARAIADGFLCPYVIEPFPEHVPPPGPFELYFCRSNQAAQQLAQQTPRSAYIGHETKDRAAILRRFRSGSISRLYLNRCLIEGFDCPQVSRVFLDKNSDSALHLYQIAGRGLRRKSPGKLCHLFARDPLTLSAALDRA